MPRRRVLIAGAVWTTLILILTACSGLAGDPVIVATIPPRPTQVAQVAQPVAAQPATSPDLALGAQIYEQSCAECHGENGEGGDRDVRGQLVEDMPPFNNPMTARDDSPATYFDIITNGLIDQGKLMPPFASLSDHERWSVASYVYTLDATDEQLAQGAEIWEAQCAECHGLNGEGTDDGIPVEDLSDLGDDILFDLVTNGRGQLMPAFGEDLDEGEIWSVIAHARTLTFADGETLVADADAGTDSTDASDEADETADGETEDDESVPAPATTEDPADTATTDESDEAETDTADADSSETAGEPVGTISGQITVGTAGSELPEDTEVSLIVVDMQSFEQNTLRTTVNEDGSYRFDDLPMDEMTGFVARVNYQDRFFPAQPARGNPEDPNLEMPITVYDVTTDESALQGSFVSMRFMPGMGTIQALQIMGFNATGDRMYSSDTLLNDEVYATLRVNLPETALVNLPPEAARRYVPIDGEAAVYDSVPVYPGEEHIVSVPFELPHEDSTELVFSMPYDLDGTFEVWVTDPLRILSDSLQLVDTVDSEGVIFNVYTMDLTLTAGETFSYTITGDVNLAGEVTETSVTQSGEESTVSTQTIAMLLGGLGVLLLGFAAVMFVLNRNNQNTAQQPVTDPATPTETEPDPSVEARKEDLIQQIAALDVQFKEGALDDETYQQQRDDLKAQLAALLRGE